MYHEYDHVVHQYSNRLSVQGVESLAGEPESPKALAVPIKAIRAIVSKPIDAPKV